jgi:alkylhydroperoxidase family enzyme
MARVPYISKEAAKPEIKKLYEDFESQFGMPAPNVAKALANSPGLATKVFPLGNYFMNRSQLDPRIRELAVLMLMKRCDCDYGFVHHIPIAKRVGVTQEQIDAIDAYQTSGKFSDNDKLILRYSEELTTKVRVDDDLFRRVEKIVSKEGIVDLTGAIAFWNMMARNLNALQVELES